MLVDRGRATAAHHGAPASSERALPTRIYLPQVGGAPAVRAGPFPLFVWAHGIGATIEYFDPILRSWAARGYVVVAPSFPLTRSGAPGGPLFGDYINQPADVSFVIGQVLNRFGPHGVAIPGLVDGSRIAAGGHSLGAVTTFGMVSAACCIDPRVGAAVEIDGAVLPFPDGGAIPRPIPTLLIHGDADTTFPVAESRNIYSRSLSPKFLIVLHGVAHTAFDIPPVRQVIVSTVADFLDLYLKQRPGSSNHLTADGTVVGFTMMSSAP